MHVVCMCAAGANCENAVECCVDRAPDEPMDVMCACGATFCFNCKEEAHRPVGGVQMGQGGGCR
jgi:ariadne-1